ncbi:hypothetical protein CAEBREN_17619 [Caenorhabditis brenneri]|uniref:Uncharacterized protein n=1 Tax=Caenorhabditis brenneri TaxID=135651 RepID=G0MEK2_CAEBE|nr:hypothetical protein CAEBREN_17619 [Caenorhabditis brenneri]
MSERRQELSQMLDNSLKTFTNVLLESKDLAKLTRHSKMNMPKTEVDVVMARMIENAQKKVQVKTSALIDENKICERFDELEELIKESEKMNQELGLEAGYQFVKPKRDIAYHLAETTESMLNQADAEIARLEKELEAEDEELAHRKQILKELTTVVESQQQKLWNSSGTNKA